MNLHLTNKVALITGAAKGIGAATARTFIDEGASVALLDIDESTAALAKDLGPRAKFFPCDVSNSASVSAAIQSTLAAFGHLDVLVNNAGIQSYGTVVDTPEETWDRTLNINLKGPFLCAKHGIPAMQQRGAGVIINVASVQAFLTQANVAAYSTSKTALLGLTRSIAVDYAPIIRCVAVCPGSVDTPMLRWGFNQSPNPDAVLAECQNMHLLQRIATPEEIASTITYLASDAASFITGQSIRVDGGLGISIPGSKRNQ